jgi:hypothetical protein
MSQPVIQTNALFSNSLRSWQAAWRAEKGLAAQAETSAEGVTATARRPRRLIRPRRTQQPRPQA